MTAPLLFPQQCRECGAAFPDGSHHRKLFCGDCLAAHELGKRSANNRRAYNAAKQREGTNKTPKGWSVRNKEHHARIKAAALAYLGGKCVRCGESDARVLEADHVQGGRIRDKRSTYSRYRAILKGTEEGTFQLLCCNCNRRRQHEDGQWRGYLG